MGGLINNYVIHLLGALALCCTSAASAGDNPVIVVNSAINPQFSLSPNTLNAIFGMRLRKWDDGSAIKVFVLPDSDPLHVAFSKNILRVFPYQLRSAWDRLVFSGTGEEPIKVDSEQKMRESVSSTPGAIGYLSGSMVDSTVKPLSLLAGF